ncbi:MAG: thioredoxin family protein [Actinobacteria bacterium]|nr:thioredoxin family protein [Actinomycetota bacterium]
MNPGLAVLLVALVAASVFGLVRRRSDGLLREAGDVARDRGPAVGERPGPPTGVLGVDDLGGPLGTRFTLVQFSSDFCQPCRVTRTVLTDVAQTVPGVVHVEIDAASNLDLVRRVDVRRTPTVLVLDGSGREIRRAAGAPRKAAVLAFLAELS